MKRILCVVALALWALSGSVRAEETPDQRVQRMERELKEMKAANKAEAGEATKATANAPAKVETTKAEETPDQRVQRMERELAEMEKVQATKVPQMNKDERLSTEEADFAANEKEFERLKGVIRGLQAEGNNLMKNSAVNVAPVIPTVSAPTVISVSSPVEVYQPASSCNTGYCSSVSVSDPKKQYLLGTITMKYNKKSIRKIGVRMQKWRDYIARESNPLTREKGEFILDVYAIILAQLQGSSLGEHATNDIPICMDPLVAKYSYEAVYFGLNEFMAGSSGGGGSPGGNGSSAGGGGAGAGGGGGSSGGGSGSHGGGASGGAGGGG